MGASCSNDSFCTTSKDGDFYLYRRKRPVINIDQKQKEDNNNNNTKNENNGQITKFISPFDVLPEYTINVNSNTISSAEKQSCDNNEFTNLLQQQNNENLGKDDINKFVSFQSNGTSCTSCASSVKSATEYHSFVDDLISQKDNKSSHLFSPHPQALVSEQSSSQLSEEDEEDEVDEDEVNEDEDEVDEDQDEAEFEEDEEVQRKREMIKQQAHAGRKSSLLRKRSVWKWKTNELDHLSGEITQQIQSLQKLGDTENSSNNIQKDRD